MPLTVLTSERGGATRGVVAFLVMLGVACLWACAPDTWRSAVQQSPFRGLLFFAFAIATTAIYASMMA